MTRKLEKLCHEIKVGRGRAHFNFPMVYTSHVQGPQTSFFCRCCPSAELKDGRTEVSSQEYPHQTPPLPHEQLHACCALLQWLRNSTHALVWKKQSLNHLMKLLNKKDIGQYLVWGAKMVWGHSGLAVLAESPGCKLRALNTAHGRDAFLKRWYRKCSLHGGFESPM